MYNMIFSAIRGNGLNFSDILAFILSSLFVIFFILPIHEFAHGFTASKLGDPTPRYQGRLTLNPFAHIDYMGALTILIFGFGWARPVQVNSRNFDNPKRDMAITALAGPVSNLIVAFAFSFILNLYLMFFSGQTTIVYLIFRFLIYIIYINIRLAVFNLIPIPPLDGSKILAAFLPDRIYYRLMQYEQYFFIIIFALVFFGSLSFLSDISDTIMSWFVYITGLPFNLS